MDFLKNAWRRWSKWSLPTRLAISLSIILGVPGLIISAAAWYWPDFWKHPLDEERGTHKQSKPVGSEWREEAPRESFTFVSLNYPDAPNTFPTSINDGGAIVGIYTAPKGRLGFIRNRDGSFTSFEYPRTASTTNATGINNNNEIVGFYYDSSKGCHGSPAHGFLRNRDGTFASFDYPDTSYTFAHGINDKREVVGAYEDCDGIARGFLRHGDGSFSPLDYPGAVSTIPTGINNQGEIIGYWRDHKFGERGFLRRGDGAFTPIMPDPTTSSYPKGLNNGGDVVGHTSLGPFLRRRDGTLSSIDHPACLGGTCTIPTGINNLIEVVGQYQTPSGVHGFLAKAKSKQTQ